MSTLDVKRRVNVGLLWHSINSGNLGVGALTIADIALVKEIALAKGVEPHLVVIGMRDSGSPYLHDCDVEVFGLDTTTLFSPMGYWRKLRELNCILDIGAGDSFAEIYGFRRFVFLWLTKLLASLRGIPIVLAPQTIGPFTKFPYRFMASMVMQRAFAICARDRLSYDQAKSMTSNANVVLSSDVAFALPYEVSGVVRYSSDLLKIGINVSGLLYNEARTGKNRFGLSFDYATLMEGFIRYCVGRKDIEIHLIAHVKGSPGAIDDDAELAKYLGGQFPTVIRVPNFDGPSQAKSYISGLDLLVAGRMHACIAAYSAGVPVVPISYSRKFSGLFGTLNYPWIVPAVGMSTDAALSYLVDCLHHRLDIVDAITKGNLLVADLLASYKGVLGKLFDSVRSQ